MSAITIWSLEDAKKEHKHDASLSAALSKLIPSNKTVIDFGCGKGSYLRDLSKTHKKLVGVEGTKGIEQIADYSPIRCLDLSKPIQMRERGTILCLEVAEHLLPEQEAMLLDNIDRHCNGLLVLSWALPKQGGHGHNNERDAQYVISTLTDRGYTFDDKATGMLRDSASLWWFKKSIYVFNRKK
jgi:hypothetical protein